MKKLQQTNEKNKKEIVSLINENSDLKSKLESGQETKAIPDNIVENGGENGLYDITNLITENRDLKDRLHKILCDTERSRIGQRKLEELSILLKMKNLDLEQKYHKVQEENTMLSVENLDLRSKSGASSVFSFPGSSCADLDEKLKSPSDEMAPMKSPSDEMAPTGFPPDLNQLLSEKDSLTEKNKELASKISEMESENNSLRLVLQQNNKVDTKLKDDLTNISVECEKLKQEIQNVEFDGGAAVTRLTPLPHTLADSTQESCNNSENGNHQEVGNKINFQDEIGKLNSTIADMRERLKAVNKNLFECADKDVMIDQLKEELTVKESEIQALNEKESLLNDKLNVLSQQIKTRDQNMKDSTNKLESMESDNTGLQATIQNLKQELNQSQEKCINIEGQMKALNVKIIDLENDLRVKMESEKQLTESQADYKELTQKANEDIEKQKMKMDSLQKSLEENKLILEEKEKQIDQMKELVVEKENENSAMKKKQDELNEALKDLKGMNEMFLNTAREKEKELTAKKKALTELESQEANLRAHCDKIGKENTDLRGQLSDNETRVSSLSGEISRLEAELASRLDIEAALTQELQKAQMEASEESPLVQVLNERSRELSEARSQVQHYTSALQAEKDRLTKLEEEHFNALQVERDRVAKLEEQQIEMRSTYAEMQDEGMKRLTCLVRDKDLELSSLQDKHASLITILQQDKDRLDTLEAENKALITEVEQLKLRIEESKESEVEQQSTAENVINVCDNNQQVIQHLREKITQLENNSQQASNVDTTTTSQQNNVKDLENKVKELTEKLLSTEALYEELKKSSESKSAEQKVEFSAEVDRLRNDLKTLAQDRNSIEERLRSKEKESSDLHKEVRSVIDKKRWVEGELERLRGHLVSVEESYTQELVQGEERETELRARVGELEDQVKRASLSHSEASQEANEAATHLTEALTAAAATRDSLSDQLKLSQTKLREKSSSLRNLQLALEGFQKQKENEIRLAERKCQNLLEIEHKKSRDMEEQLDAAKKQLSAANEGLEAASRVSQQLELKQHHIAALKHEISTLEELLQEANEKVKTANTAQVGKVDRDLIKNLILGYVTADAGKRPEILRIIATVLDFSQEDRGRTGLDGEARGWLGGLLAARGQGSNQQLNQSIAQAFVKFLEEESVPVQTVQLPVLEMARRQQEHLSMSGSSQRSTPSPLLLNSIPTFSPTSTILKTVLDEEQPSAQSDNTGKK
eukprot:TRINITY_DN6322_c0_g1_i16.p1 TRINITY_DN6322_c0_g1~~TRINITY_DN6322_c0_g1_i16.p1  ORF type:complete len:1229 (-),score=429.49 TRINITY_DN6322_c0_g1_i16:385-4071(-)